ncbi:hypothetical protein ACLMM6_12680 [Xanthomonas campestris pv. incanae]|uniref:hypothetical protein n=1 Tax=Xanthomonas campestris TaxID=339 RepID=UPI0029C3E974|nr:hypothetical protein [Xanthomonas campestris]MDX6088120.1 hypothetical protein [Xanthomonas campestris pv. incanae]
MKNVEIPDEDIEHIIRAIRKRLESIGPDYSGSHTDDFEIAALVRLAKQLGYIIEITKSGNGFTIKIAKI